MNVYPLMLDAVKKLYEYYTKDTGYYLHNCPMCRAGEELADRHGAAVCDYCPWMIYEKQSCLDYAAKKFPSGRLDVGSMRSNKTEEWIKLRLPMMRKWMRKMTKELNNQ